MKKKIIAIAMLATVALSSFAVLVGCSSEGEPVDSDPIASTKEEVLPEYYFKNNVAELDDVRIEITEYRIIQPGAEGNEYGSKPVIAFWYKTTNKTGADVTPLVTWTTSFTAIQDNDPNSINELDVAMLPDDRFTRTQLETIKKDGTVEMAMAYELDNLTTPVTLVVTNGLLGEELGSQNYEIAGK